MHIDDRKLGRFKFGLGHSELAASEITSSFASRLLANFDCLHLFLFICVFLLEKVLSGCNFFVNNVGKWKLTQLWCSWKVLLMSLFH